MRKVNTNTIGRYKSRALIKLNKRSASCAIALVLILPVAAWAKGVVTNCTEAALRAAMAGGGMVGFACDVAATTARTRVPALIADALAEHRP